MQKQSTKSFETKMRVGTTSFSVTFFENESVKGLKQLFPLTVTMKDLHSNEKFFDLPHALPTNSSNVMMIKAGDIMLYGSNTLVVFYKSFPTVYSYTRLGQVNDPASLETALGSGNVTLTLGSE